jgi:hypothetical protein
MPRVSVTLAQRSPLKIAVIALLLIVLPCASGQVASAQTTTASITGTIKDATGSVLPGVSVVVTNSQTGVSREGVVTDAAGRYLLTNLPIGQYEVSATLAGFRTVLRRGIDLTIGREAMVDFSLALGELETAITVTGDAPLVDLGSAGLGGIVDRNTIMEIPLSGRDMTGLITLQAGTVMSTRNSEGSSSGFSNKFSIGGARVGENSILLDGTEVKGFDAGVPAGVTGNFMGGEGIQEFRVERNAYSAEFGGSAGGVVNVVSKGGANDFHGSGYGFFRNSSWDAVNFRAPNILDSAGNVVGRQKPDFWRAQYGASAGGRIVRNRTFYFANFEGMRERLSFPVFINTLTAAGRRGILGSRTVPVKPGMAPYLEMWPLPPADAVDLGDGRARYSVINSQPTDEDYYQIRVDHNFSGSDSVFGRVTRQTSKRRTPQDISRWRSDDGVFNTFVTGEYKKIYSEGLLNTFRFGFNRRAITADSFEDLATDPAAHLVPLDQWSYPLGSEPVMGGVSATGLTGYGHGRGWVDRRVNRFQFVDSVVYTRGRNMLKFGVDFLHMRMGGFNSARPAGSVTFGSVEALLQGLPRQLSCGCRPEADWWRNLRWNTFGSYAQFDWEINSRLTVNLGLRHEFYTVPKEKDGKTANLRQWETDTALTFGDPWWQNPSFKNFAPRVGLAWDPTGQGKTAIRAGGGIFHNLIQPEMFRMFPYRTPPALETVLSAAEGVIPFPVGFFQFMMDLGPQAGQVFVFPYDDGGNARMMQWNVNVQQELLGNMGITVGYAGSKGVELFQQVALNTAVADVINGRYVFPANAARPNPAFNVNLQSPQNWGESWYNSLQVEMQRRFNAGWQMGVAYTYSHSEDTASAFTPTFEGGGANGSGYVHDILMGKSLSSFHVQQRMSANGVWQLPFGKERRYGADWPVLADAILGGWQLSGIVQLSDGSPIEIGIGARADLAAIGLEADRPDLISGGDPSPVIGDPDRYFDASQFVFPAARTIGSLNRNTLITAGLINVDMGLSKTFVMGTRRAQLRLEVFNLLDRANLGIPDTTVFNNRGVAQAGAGFIEATSTPARQIQLGLRYDW